MKSSELRLEGLGENRSELGRAWFAGLRRSLVRRGRPPVSALLALLATSAVLLSAPAGPALAASHPAIGKSVRPTSSSAGFRLGPWHLVGQYSRDTLVSGQGLATVTDAAGRTRTVYRGDLSIPPRLQRAGWQHIGDPGARGGYLVDSYQGPDNARSKLFEVTTPWGERYDLTHPLAALHPAEQFNNSFAAVSPNLRWLVSGEWDAMQRLLVFPMPTHRPGIKTRDRLPVAGLIRLNRVVRNVQGCDFVSSRRLLCSSDDPSPDLFGVARPLLQVDLQSTLPNSIGVVTSLGGLPQNSACAGTFETEGIDYAPSGTMRVEVIPPPPCALTTTVYVYRRS